MKPGSRRTLLFVVAGGLLTSVSGLMTLRIGRPLYYSDGERTMSAVALRNASMLDWGRPEPEVEIPGPVRGRVVRLPDGRFLYGLAAGPRRTDLVLFDSRLPGLASEPVLGLGSPGHDLAPAFQADGDRGQSGTLFFASDRRGGSGGFDLYSARYRDGVFYAVERLPETINTKLDETDPAPEPGGERLVFIRRDPGLFEGRNGKLWIAAGNAEPEPLFPDEISSASRVPIDRDPAFAPDGVGLWFVRQLSGEAALVMRSYRHQERFVEPMPESSFLAGGPFRGPLPSADGFELRLLKPGENAVLYRSRAHEVFPWWEGQRWLERLLLSLTVFFAVLLMLLSLGGRWRQLDLITKLLFISMLIHLLLLLWLSSMEIIRRFTPKPEADDRARVRLLAAQELASAPGSGELRQEQPDLSRELEFPGREEPLRAASPAAELEHVAFAGERSQSEELPIHEPAQNAADAKLRDAVRESRKRSERDARTELLPRPLAEARAARAREKAQRRSPGAEAVIEVALPGSQVASPSGDRASVLPEPPRASPEERVQDERPARVADAPAAVKPRAAATQASPLTARRSASVPIAGAALSTRRASGGQMASDRPSPAPGLLVAASGPRVPGSEPGGLPVPGRRAGPLSLQDAPEPEAHVAARAPAERRAGLVAAGSASPSTESGSPKRLQRRSRAAGLSGPESPAGLLARAPGRAPEPASRALPEPALAADPSVALGDQPRARTEKTPGAPAEQAPAIVAGAYGRPAFSAAEPRAKRTRERDSGRAEARIPGSLFGKAERRARAASEAERSEPRPRDLSGFVALRDPPGEPRTTKAAASGQATELRARLARLAGPGQAPAASPLRPRAHGESENTREAGARAPASLLARAARVPGGSFRPVPLSATRDLDAGLAVTRDTESSAPPLPRKTEEESGYRLAGLARPGSPSEAAFDEPRRHAAGGRKSSAEIALPGSFLGREGMSERKPEERKPSPYSNRFGQKKLAALRRYGGTEETERAVQNGLAYLARIQNEDGSWGNKSRTQRKYGEVFVGKTGLCLLAFLGAGHSPYSKTEHSALTKRAVDFLLYAQDSHSGHFGLSSSYSHGIATYALAECNALHATASPAGRGDPVIQDALDRAVEWILDNQSRSRDRRNRGGWGYFSPTLRPEDRYSRASVSAWQIMALESAKLSGIEIPERRMEMARDFLLQCFDRRGGYFLYNREPSRLRSSWRTLPASTPASVFCLLLLGMPVSDERLVRGLEFTLERRPRAYRRHSEDDFVRRAAGNVYFWYYASLATFLAGGEAWDRWNAALKRLLPRAQSADGSFRPIDPYARYAGDTERSRAYTTAMCVLSLEVYYRYFTPLLKDR